MLYRTLAVQICIRIRGPDHFASCDFGLALKFQDYGTVVYKKRFLNDVRFLSYLTFYPPTK
jgi:hypothetical protein